MKSVAVIIPTIGSKHLNQCLVSILNQTYKNIIPYIIVDGTEHDLSVYNKTPLPQLKHMHVVKNNVGADGWYGHRIYAAFSYLVNTDLVCFLDEDNWIEPNHVESLVKTIEDHKVGWAYSLRNIYDKDGNFVCQDNCESLGKWNTWTDTWQNHIDTSCFCVKREILVQVAHSWYGKYGQDRVFFNTLKHYFPSFDCSREYTLNYRCGATETSVQPQYFVSGNAHMEELHPNGFPWSNK